MSYIVSLDQAKQYFRDLHKIFQLETPRERAVGLRQFAQSLENKSVLVTNKLIFDNSLYPALPGTELFSAAEEMTRYIDKRGRLLTPEHIQEELKASPLAQLLYCLVWKNGDLGKFRPLRLGLTSGRIENLEIDGDEENNSYVFYQFGKHILNRNEPIVDRHTGRAYAFYLLLFPQKSASENRGAPDQMDFEKCRKINGLRKREYLGMYYNKKVHQGYPEWVAEVLPIEGSYPALTAKSKSKSYREDALSNLDRIMFTLGKMLAAKRPSKNPKKG